MRISATPMRKYAYQGGTFILYRYELFKITHSISDQISLLKGRGLVIGDDAYAKEQLGIISYFRLADYFQPLEDNHSLHTFKSDATFEDAVTLYYFDKELRSLIFTAIQSIEIALRSK